MEMDCIHQQLREATSKIQEQKETLEIYKQKYTTAIAKVFQVQRQVKIKENELQHLRQKEELTEMQQRYEEKVNHWESTSEALDQLTDELQANQSLLRESQQEVERLRSHVGALHNQMDSLKQQKVMVDCSEKEYLHRTKLRQQQQECCTNKDECLARTEKAILERKLELWRRTQEKEDLQQSLSQSHKPKNNCSQIEKKVRRLKEELGHLKFMLDENKKVHRKLFSQAEKQLTQAKQESARRSVELDLQRRETRKHHEEFCRTEEKMRNAIKEIQTLRIYYEQLKQQLLVLQNQHQMAVEELAVGAEEARRMEGCLNEGKLAEEKISTEKRSIVIQSLNKTKDMHSRLQSNLEAISMLNQQLNILCRENKHLRRQLEEERSMRRQVEQELSLPPASQHCSSIHLPVSLSTQFPLISASFSSTLGLPHLLNSKPAGRRRR
ncbi:uncharacterized protein LOC105356674 isoform X2 [Oryzias latipes]